MNIAFHKPYLVVSQFTPPSSASPNLKTPVTLSDYIAVKDVYPVGRLDHDSEGLLLLTDDGPLQHKLTDPRFGHKRTYWVQVEGKVDDEAAARLCGGVVIQGRRTLPCEALVMPRPEVPERDPPIRVRQKIPTSWLQITLTEGRNRQVRRMTAAVGFPTLRLIRVSLGTLHLGALSPGEWRNVSSDELKALRQR